MTSPRVPRWAAVGAASAALLLAAACDRPAVEAAGPGLSLTATLGGTDTAGYARAVAPRPFTFPADHGPHPAFKTEWWYVTGNLSATDGRPLGFQFTIFRSALAPTAPDVASAWSTNQAWMGHFALTDPEGERFLAFERFGRGAAGVAGARARPFDVHLDDWRLAEADTADPATFPLRLSARDDGAALDLVLQAGKPRVLQGVDGLSQKGPEPGNASYYYAHTRMPAEGRVVLGPDTFEVRGLAWLDREWSTSSLSDDQVGWDWFALQMDDGWDLMVYQLRSRDGRPHPLSDGVLIDPDGARTPLAWGQDVRVTPTGTWRSPLDGAEYPSGWRVEVPLRGWDLDVEPVLPDQELDLAFRYWEGAVRATGARASEPVAGRGYVELTGYAGSRPRR